MPDLLTSTIHKVKGQKIWRMKEVHQDDGGGLLMEDFHFTHRAMK
jgi:hypothetical protein